MSTQGGSTALVTFKDVSVSIEGRGYSLNLKAVFPEREGWASRALWVHICNDDGEYKAAFTLHGNSGGWNTVSTKYFTVQELLFIATVGSVVRKVLRALEEAQPIQQVLNIIIGE